MMNTLDLMETISNVIYNEYYIIIYNPCKLNEVHSGITFHLLSEGIDGNSFLGVTERMVPGLRRSRFLFLHDLLFQLGCIFCCLEWKWKLKLT